MDIFKPERQPDHVDSRGSYWFDEMLCVVSVSFPMATSVRVCKMFLEEFAFGALFARFPNGAVKTHSYLGEDVKEAYEQWKLSKAETILIGEE